MINQIKSHLGQFRTLGLSDFTVLGPCSKFSNPKNLSLYIGPPKINKFGSVTD